MTARGNGTPKPIGRSLGTITSAEGTRLSSSNRPDQAAKYGPGSGDSERTRMNYLSVTETVTLRDWAQAAVRLFPDAGPAYQVGSSLHRLDWRDVDVRLLLEDDRYDALASVLHVRRLNHAISLWGQQVTGLPIDFQVQRMTDANEEYPTWRNPLLWIDGSEDAR